MANILIVGAGLSGTTVARVLAEKGHSIVIIDQRPHIAGNTFDRVNEHGIRIHEYGPHLFHTSDEKVVEFLSNFTEWTPYFHKVKAMLSDGRLVTLPVNIETLNIVGKDNIVDTFFRPYTKKMWGLDIEQLDPTIMQRVPVRNDMNELYFPNDKFQALPKYGYTSMISNMLNHKNIQINLSTKFDKVFEKDFDHVFNSMSIDEYFENCYGVLPYRSIRFHHFSIPTPQVHTVATVNFTHNGPFTRITEWKNLPGHSQNPFWTSLTIEEPCEFSENNYERYYPVKDINGHNRQLYNKYRSLISPQSTFIGRCGLYAYLDMHQAVSSAITIANKF
jgi:UDP-galactopyranose mutase